MTRWVALLCATLGACTSPAGTAERGPTRTNAANKVRVQALRAHENALRKSFEPEARSPWIDVSGSDPYRIARLGSGFVGILRGSSALVRLNGELEELDRVQLPQTPSALCVTGSGDAWVASRYGRQLLRVQGENVRARRLEIAGVADLACGPPGVVYVLPADGTDLLTLSKEGAVLDRRPALSGGSRLKVYGGLLLESSLHERSLRVLQLSERGVPQRELTRVQHDGTIWGFDALWRDSQLLLAVAGVEDKPLLRAHGEFENIDSFVWVYRFAQGKLERLAELDVSESGVVVPKAVQLSSVGDGVALDVLAAGSGRALRAVWSTDWAAAPQLFTRPALPGAVDAVFEADGSVSYASPLFDGWVRLGAGGARLTRVDPERLPDVQVRLGEALFFTELMAPQNGSEGSHSRFTCETCHLEGGVDGRVHHTGRGDVSVVTKPLFGLANNRPHFSRALDPDLSSVCHNEFRVAGAGSGTDPWFSLETARFPWLHPLGIHRAQLEPIELRRALLEFLYQFAHSPNPRAQGRHQLSALERDGARVFLQHCQSCHAARLATDDRSSEQPLERWEALVLSRNAPLVWARGDYEKVGILPYVHEHGARIPSLRRLELKPRYFTNGSSPDLESVLQRFRTGAGRSLHADSAEGARLSPLSAESRRALLAFLQLL